jgi:hypothetical protein
MPPDPHVAKRRAALAVEYGVALQTVDYIVKQAA